MYNLLQNTLFNPSKSQLASLQTIEEEASDEQYKFVRLKRRTNRVNYPGGTTKVGELHANYRSICSQVKKFRAEYPYSHFGATENQPIF